LKLFTFWIHGLEQERSWMRNSQVDAAGSILGSLNEVDRDRASRLALLEVATADAPVVVARRRTRNGETSIEI